jgi:DegT/DnrJ/EryC1/StrS aminotransferase family
LSDAAQSFGPTYRGRSVGTIGTATATSFFPAKPLGCYGDGGAIFTDDAELAAAVKSLRVHGQGSDKYDNVRIGMNGRLDTLQAAILIEKLGIFRDEIECRNRIAARYNSALADVVQVPQVIDGAVSVGLSIRSGFPPPFVTRSARASSHAASGRGVPQVAAAQSGGPSCLRPRRWPDSLLGCQRQSRYWDLELYGR